MDKEKEYDYLSKLELESTRLRHTTFTALLSISFIVAGLATKADTSTVVILGHELAPSRLVFFLGFVFYLFAVVHYSWHHRYAHRYRAVLKKLESDLGISVYRVRVRPRLWKFKLHYNWALYVVGLLYGAIAVFFIGLRLFVYGLLVVIVPYGVLLLASYWQEEEPLEK